MVDGGKGGEYRAAMTLMALATGAPRSALDVLNFLRDREPDESVSVLEQHLGKLEDAEEAHYAVAALTAYCLEVGDSAPTLRDLRHWVPNVARFSFRSGRM